MSVRNTGSILREARKRSGLTADAFCKGICDYRTLYRIERGELGISVSNFQFLMSRIGGPKEFFPVFASRDDFDCFFALKHARFHLNSWQLDDAFKELQIVESKHWANNKIHYQEWILLYCKLLFRSGFSEHKVLFSSLSEALHITRPDCDTQDIHKSLLSVTEAELLLMIAQEYLSLDDTTACYLLLIQLKTYFTNSKYSQTEKNYLQNEYDTIYTRYLVQTKNYSEAVSLATASHHRCVNLTDDTHLFELVFLNGVAQHHLGQHEIADDLFATSLVSAHAIESCYATTGINYLNHNLHYPLPTPLQKLSSRPLPSYPIMQLVDAETFSDGSFDFFDPNVIHFGKLIKILRKEQKLSQHTLCQGLCSDSMLSKIENETIQPNILLAETLLQRLGISEREFIFWGDSRDAEIHELIFKLIKAPNDVDIPCLITKLSLLNKDNNPLLKQYVMFFQAMEEHNLDTKHNLLSNALSQTLPNFDFKKILNYRLSWVELSILNNLAMTYKGTTDAYIGINIFSHLLDYYEDKKIDILLSSHTQTVMFKMYIMSLYAEKRYKEINTVCSTRSYQILKYRLSFYGITLFYYSQTLGECNDLAQAKQQGRYSHYIEKIVKHIGNATLLPKVLQRDFSVTIP